jgi:DNA-binding LacI/PurR family transcriptional regulator
MWPISDATRQKVFEAAREMGYRPNRLARALVSGRTQMLAVSLPEIKHPYYISLFHSLFDAAQERGYGVLVYQSTTGHTRRAFDWPVDGAILVDSPFLTHRKELPPDLKIVTLGALTDPTHDHVRLDNKSGAELDLRHFYQQQCRKVVQILVGPDVEDLNEKYREFAEAAVQNSLQFRVLTINSYLPEVVCAKILEDLKIHGRADGYLTATNLSTFSTIRTLADLGFRSPTDYLLVGFDGIENGQLAVPSVSSISHPIQQASRDAIEFLINRIRDPHLSMQSKEYESILIVRESSDARFLST